VREKRYLDKPSTLTIEKAMARYRARVIPMQRRKIDDDARARFWIEQFKDNPVSALTVADIERALTFLSQRAQPATVRRYSMRASKTVCAWAMRL